MAGYHTITLFLPQPTAWLAYFYSLLTRVADRHEPIEVPTEAWHGWGTIMYVSTHHHDVMDVYQCDGTPHDILTSYSGARAYHHLGYMSIYSTLHLHYAVFRSGQYVEVLAYSEDIHRDRVSDLYVRVPAISPDAYAIIPSDCSIERVWLNELWFVHPRDMSHVAYHIPSMHGFMMPLLQARVPTEVDEDFQVQHLQAVVPAALFDSIFDFASHVRTHRYDEDHIDGGQLRGPTLTGGTR